MAARSRAPAGSKAARWAGGVAGGAAERRGGALLKGAGSAAAWAPMTAAVPRLLLGLEHASLSLAAADQQRAVYTAVSLATSNKFDAVNRRQSAFTGSSNSWVAAAARTVQAGKGVGLSLGPVRQKRACIWSIECTHQTLPARVQSWGICENKGIQALKTFAAAPEGRRRRLVRYVQSIACNPCGAASIVADLNWREAARSAPLPSSPKPPAV